MTRESPAKYKHGFCVTLTRAGQTGNKDGRMSICDAVATEVPTVSVSDAADQVLLNLLGVLEARQKLSEISLQQLRLRCGYGRHDSSCERKEHLPEQVHAQTMMHLDRYKLLEYPDCWVPVGADHVAVRVEVARRIKECFGDRLHYVCEDCGRSPGKLYAAYAQRLCVECATARDNA